MKLSILIFVCTLFILFSISMATECTFRKLYKSEDEQFVVYEHLNELFKLKFAKVLKEAKAFSPYLVSPAEYFEENIKDLYISEGYKLNDIEDLETCLLKLNYLKFKDFRQKKIQFEGSTELTDILFDRRVKFDT